MRTLLLAFVLLIASGASAQTDARLYGAWVALVEVPPDGQEESFASMWLEFDARGRMFGQAELLEFGVSQNSSVVMDYAVEDGQLIADGDPAEFVLEEDGSLRITDNSTAMVFVRPGAVILGLDVIGLWAVDGGPSGVASFAHSRDGLPTVTFHLADADPSVAGYQPHDEGTWRVSADGLTMETALGGTVLYNGIRREGNQITLFADDASLTLRPLAPEAQERFGARDTDENLDEIRLEFDAPVEAPSLRRPPPPEPAPPVLPIDAP